MANSDGLYTDLGGGKWAQNVTPIGSNPDGSTNVVVTGSNAPLPNVLLADGKAIPNTSIFANVPMLYNGTTLDMQRGNTQGTLLASAARVATTDTAIQTNHSARGAMFTLDITIASGTGGLQVAVYHIDPVSGKKAPINAIPTSIVTTGITNFLIYPGAATTGNRLTQACNSALPRQYIISVVHGDATSYTYSLGYQLIL